MMNNEELFKNVDIRLQGIESNLEIAHNSLKKNFYHYFAQISEDIYKKNYIKDCLLEIHADLEDGRSNLYIQTQLEEKVKRLEKDLLTGKLARHSSNVLTNLQFHWELEAKQEVIKLFKDYLR